MQALGRLVRFAQLLPSLRAFFEFKSTLLKSEACVMKNDFNRNHTAKQTENTV